MATKEIVELVDDIDGTPAIGTTRFALDHVEYEIDLSAPHSDALRELLDRYIDKGRRMSRTPPRTRRQPAGDDPQIAAAAKEHRRRARAWGQRTGWVNPANGKPIGDQGVVPASLLAAYDAAQQLAASEPVVRAARGNGGKVPGVAFRASS